MERGERDLADIIAHDLVAGMDKPTVVQILRSIADCLLTLEEAGRIHGDVKPRNAMEFRKALDSLFETVAAWLADIGMEAMADEFEGTCKTMADVMEMESEATESVLQAAEDKGLANVHKMRTDLEQ